MPESFAQPDDLGYGRASDIRTSLGESLAAQAGEAFMGGTRTLFRLSEYARAQGIPEGDSGLPLRDPEPIPEVPIDAARARVKQEGLESTVKLPDQPAIKAPVLDLMVAHGHEQRDYDAAVGRGPQGFLPGALGFVTSIGAGLIDPVNVAAFSIPVVGEARTASLLAAAGESVAGRAAVRAGLGAAQGAVGSAALVPPDWWLHTLDGQDYTMADALRSVIMGAGMGGVLHAGLGALGDIRARARGAALPGGAEDALTRALRLQEARENAPESASGESIDTTAVPGVGEEPNNAPVSPAEARLAHPAEVLADLPPAVREDAARAAMADVINGRPVRVGEMLTEAAKEEPRIAASLSAARTDLPPLADGAQIVGHGDHGPVVEGLQDRWPEAVSWLRQAQAGDARGVLEHPDVPGRVDVIWGDRNHGLAHIDAKHPGDADALPQLWGELKVARADDKFIELRSPRATAVVARDYGGDPKTWLLTFFQRTDEGGARPPGETIRSPGDSGPAAQSPASPREGTVGGNRADFQDPIIAPVLSKIRVLGSPMDIALKWARDPDAVHEQIDEIMHDIRAAEKALAARHGVKISDLEDAPLSKAERDFLYYGDEHTGVEEWRDIEKQLQPVDSLAEAAREIGYELKRLPDPKSKLDFSGELVVMRLQVLFSEVERLGGNLNSVLREAASYHGNRFSDPEDAVFMVREAAERLRALFENRGAEPEALPQIPPPARQIADFQKVADMPAPEDRELNAASKDAAELKDPESTDQARAPSAAEKAAADAEQLLEDLRPKLSDDERAQFDEALAALDREHEERARMIEEGAACLAAAVA